MNGIMSSNSFRTLSSFAVKISVTLSRFLYWPTSVTKGRGPKQWPTDSVAALMDIDRSILQEYTYAKEKQNHAFVLPRHISAAKFISNMEVSLKYYFCKRFFISFSNTIRLIKTK